MRRRDSRGEIDLPVPAAPYPTLVGGDIALDFTNTVDRHDESKTYDHFFPGYGNLIGWSLHAGLIDKPHAASCLRIAKREPRDAVAVRRRAVALREALFNTIGDATADADEHDLAVLNDEWRLTVVNRQLVTGPHGSLPDWIWSPEPQLDSILWPITFAGLELLTSEKRARIRQCESPTCEWLFLDTTKNGSRRFCRSQGCGNRVRVQRFREANRDPFEGP